jgi:pimeloyl-ACP methyl ester carboxylesterase
MRSIAIRFAMSCFLFLSFAFDARSQIAPQPGKPSRGWLTVDTIMRDQKWMGTSPSNVFWSEDGENVYFNWRQNGDEDDSLYKGGTPRRVSLEERKKLPSRFGTYNKDKTKKLYTKGGDIFLYDIRRKKETRLTNTVMPESGPRFTFDEQKVVFERDRNLFLLDLASAAEVQLTNLQSGSPPREAIKTDEEKYLEKQQLELIEVLRERKTKAEGQKKLQEALEVKHPKPYYIGQKSVSSFVLSPDERFITFALTQRPADAKRTIVPNYVTESGFTEEIPGRTKVGEPPPTSEFYVYNGGLDSVMQVKYDDLPEVLAKRASGDTTKARAKARPVFFNRPYWSDDGKHAFVQIFSEDNKDRWLVMLDAENAKLTTLLDRQHDDAWIGGPGIRGFGFSTTVGWLPDSRRVYFQSEEDGWSHLYAVTLDGKTKTQLTNKMDELYLMDNKPSARATRITSSPSEEFRSYDWRAPDVLTFRARDGADVPVRLYKPDKPNGAAVIFVHGAGYLQDAHKGWSDYVHEYMFNNLLADKGYTVLDIDYRGSAGLGRNWRTAIYRHMGGQDLDDQVDGARWLVEQHGIDPKRIGLYGGSYGGFITLMAMFTTPDVFAAGAALRPVTDWAHYNHGYTSDILNIPQDDSVAYQRSSPIYFASGLKGALLICHGIVDVNVHFQDAVRLVQRLIELKKKNWELAVYINQ